jgi:hypothetical protein
MESKHDLSFEQIIRSRDITLPCATLLRNSGCEDESENDAFARKY